MERFGVNDINAWTIFDKQDMRKRRSMFITIKPSDESSIQMDNEKTKKPFSFKKALVSIGSESNVHGISRLVSNRPPFLRFLWFIAFLGATSFGIFQVSTIIELYLEYPVKTDVKIVFEPLPFPAITICNMNIIKKSQSGRLESKKLKNILNGTFEINRTSATGDHTTTYIVTSTESTTANMAFGTVLTTETSNYSMSSNELSQADADSWLNNSLLNVWTSSSKFYSASDAAILMQQPPPVVDSYILYQTFVDEYEKLDRVVKSEIGHQFQDMILECQFAGRECDRPLKSIVTFDYGNCFTLQSPRYISGSSGPVGGMSFTINLENHEAFQQMTDGYGLRLVLHEIGSFPLPFEQGTTISGGYETSIGIKLTKINRLDKPWSSCKDPLEYFKKNSVRYSTQGCIKSCWEIVATRKCGCLVGYMQSEITYFIQNMNSSKTGALFNLTSSGTCYTKEERECYTQLRRDFLIDVSSYCDCPPACYESVYTPTFSGRLWPHETKMAELKQKSCAHYNETNATQCGLEKLGGMALSSNFLKVNIYFEDLNHEIITMEPLYDVNQVIADIGGSLGLCIGASFLCVCELLEVIIQALLTMKRKCTTRTHVMDNAQIE